MSILAEVLQGQGLHVQGSDMADSAAVGNLRGKGIPIAIGHAPDHIAGAEFLIRSAAVSDENPEIQAARAAGIPVFERAEAWGAIMRHYRNAVCIAGTHGKTTTTSMATHIFMAAQADPTVMIGGTLPMLHSGYRMGNGDTIILESCEYRNSFLHFSPTVAVILNVDADHLDFFKDLNDIKRSFRRFAELIPEDGFIVANAGDKNTMDALAGLPLFTFGLVEDADCHPENLVWERGTARFDVIARGEFYAHVTLKVPGVHNVCNALGAISAACLLHIPGAAVEQGLNGFTGAGRRFAYKGEYNGAKVYDDYAHNPGELHALFTMARELGYRRIVCAFQPHTYSRTKALFPDFVKELKRVSQAVLAEIYAAREKNTIGISSADLAREIPGAIYRPTLDGVREVLEAIAQPGDLILTVGAGDIYKVGEDMMHKQ